VSGGLLGDAFRDFQVSAQRLETLPAYSVSGEAERIAAWRQGLPRPERSVRTSDYLREVAENVIAGKQRQRIRIVDHPLSEYIRYEFTGYTESAAAGEEILVAVRLGGTRAAERDLGSLAQDFWLFDAGTLEQRAILLDYDEAGRFAGVREADPVQIAHCLTWWDLAAIHAVPLNTYVAAERKATAAA
jgi:hypothetical protein